MNVLLGIAALISAQNLDARPMYREAAKLLSGPEMNVAWNIRNGNTDNLPDRLPAGLSANMSPLEVIRWQSKTSKEVLARVEKANVLPFAPTPPPTVDDIDSNFPELASQKTITKAMADYAWLNFSDGKSAEGTRALLAAEFMSYRTIDESVISYLVGVAIEAIVLALLNDFLPVVSVADWDRLENMATQRLADKYLVARVYAGELLSMAPYTQLMRSQLPEPSLVTDIEDENTKAYKDPITTSYFKGLTMARWHGVLDGFGAARARKVQQIIQSLQLPEADWKLNTTDEDRNIPKVIRTDRDLTEVLSSQLSVVALDNVVFKSRAQYRLLVLHARIQKYFWNYRKYPATLADVATKSECYDPLSRKQFSYEKRESGYKLVSTGRPGMIGELALKYKRPPGSAEEKEPGPP